MASMTPLPRTKCQTADCQYRARFFVGSSAGWQGHHCGRHVRSVVQLQLFQVSMGEGIVILPFCEEAKIEMDRMSLEFINAHT